MCASICAKVETLSDERCARLYTKVLFEEFHTKRVSKLAHIVRSIRNSNLLLHLVVFHENSNFRIAVAAHAAFIDIGRTNDARTVVNNHYLAVNIHLLGLGLITFAIAMVP
ncbi:hypothetical protein PsorP6_003911 [Peronosclerospora sorghi]|uniref:Uncharacterized protein n=1 Tax=Peronosclerospora sorghi TaxID=230839 RepID=A0ACC0VLJ7_9STRA|nr:hypothetical protein PsorP6_003911 [Peronosclerospora sorghi]